MILVTRPVVQTNETAEILRGQGHEVLCEPMLEIVPVGQGFVGDLQAILLTSVNAVEFLPEGQPLVLAVGDKTAQAACDAGFAYVHSAGGCVDDLHELALKMLKPDLGPIMHFCGQDVTGDLVEKLQTQGFKAERHVVYSAQGVENLTKSLQTHLKQGDVRSALFFSPRTATVFMQNLNRAGLMSAINDVTAVCMSSAVAEPLSAGDWKKILIAEHPSQDALLNLID